MRKVIVNTTPIIALAGIGKLDLLKSLYGKIHIPEAVYNEVKGEPESTILQENLDWICVSSIRDDSQKKMYRAKLHAGEVEVMIMAQEQDADLVIMDDNAARKTARYLGLTVTGTIGVIVRAKKEHLIASAADVITELMENGLYVSDEIRQIALKEARETQKI